MTSATLPPSTSERLQSLDAYRGLIMTTLAFGGFGLSATARNHLAATPDSSLWKAVRHQFEHVEWLGCGYWDLIQPSFMFMVGMSMAYSYLSKAAAPGTVLASYVRPRVMAQDRAGATRHISYVRSSDNRLPSLGA